MGFPAAIEGYFKHSINNIFRIIPGCRLSIAYFSEFISDIIGITILAIMLIINLKQAKMAG